MNKAAEMDVGPLTWVKGEIDLALDRAVEALDKHSQANDLTYLRTARAHLHQAHGALSIVGFDGVTRFSEALEQVLEAVEESRVPYDSVANTVRHAIATIRNYLEELIAGQPDQPLRLLPSYRALSIASGQGEPAPADLFFPDLSRRPPQRAEEPATLDPAEFVRRAKSLRLAYERGLLKWLKKDARGIQEMRSALASIEMTQTQPSARAYWWAAVGFMDILAAGGVEFDVGVRRVCARIDTQMKRLVEGSRTVAERLMRSTLYYIAIGGQAGPHAESVRSAYRLDELIPSPADMADIEPLRPTLRACRDMLAPAMDDWNRFCAGAAAALPQFHDRTRQLVGRVDELQNSDVSRLGGLILATADELRRAPLSHNEALGLEMATGLLLLDRAFEGFHHLGDEFAEQVTTIGQRLDAARRGEPLSALEIPHLDEMSRLAQEKLLLGQVAKEILANLGLIEQTLDAFFRDQGRVDELGGLTKPIKQIEGALTVLGEQRAVDVLRECEDAIQKFGAAPAEYDQAAFEDVANKLSALGFFVQHLQHGPADIDQYLQPPAPVIVPEEIEPTAEIELERARRMTKTLVGALRNQPEDEALRGEIRQNLEMVRDNAELVDNTVLAEQASAAIVALENDQLSTDLAAAVAQMAPLQMVATPSEEAARLAVATSEEIDAELLGIFIEEAHEVLSTIEAQLPILAAHPHDRDALTTVRRSFHTLKGSGRMVGLSALGEAAWAVEQVLNRWLQMEQEANPPLLAMLQDAHLLFANWVAQLEAGGGLHLDASALIASCDVLKVEEPVPEAPALPAAPVPVETEVSLPPDQPELGVEEQASSDQASEAEAELGTDLVPDEEIEVTPVLELELPEIPEPPAAPSEPDLASAEPEQTPQPEAPFLRLVSTTPSIPTEGVTVGDIQLSQTLYDLYVKEAKDYISSIERELGFGEQPRPSLIRAAHTLAGISATTGIVSVHSLAHALEMALNRLSEAGAAPTEDQHLVLARAVGALEGMVGAIASKRLPETEESLTAALDALSPIAPFESEPAVPEIVPEAELEPVAELESMVEAESPIEIAPLAEFEPEIGETRTSVLGQTAEIVPPAEEPIATPPTSPTHEEAVADDRRHMRLTDELDEQLLPIFLEESVDLMRDIGNGLRAWREQPGDDAVGDQLKRVLHTLKGSARMAGAMSVGELVHGMETRIEQAVSARALTPALWDALDGSFDRLSMLMDRLQGGETEPAAEVPTTVTQEEVAAPQSIELAPAPIAASHEPVATPHLASHAAESRHEAHDQDQAARNMLRVRADIVDKLVNEAGEIAIARGRIEGEMRSLKTSLLELTENVIRLRNQLREIEIQAELQMQSRQAMTSEVEQHFDPLEFDRFTRFQELTRMMAESVNDVATSQQSLLLNLDQADAALIAQARLNREHSQALMNVRMVPFNTLADRLYRVVRQTAKELDKRANLDIRGGQTELDRSVLEKMTGPIEHLLRNAVVHGLETPEQRRSAGKSDIGEISLRVGQEGNEIAIELSDDGRGLDYERIRARGQASGLIAPDQKPTNEQLTELIFQSGFSTADALSSVAGRGVGMDVVRNEAANLGGRVHVDSTPGSGSRFLIHLPLTLAVTQAVLVRSGTRHFAIPSSMVAQVRELKPEAVAAIRTEGATHWLGNAYPYHYLPHLLGNLDAQPEPARRHWVLLLRTGDQRVAIEVDDLLGNQELVVKNIGPQLARVVGIAGATVLGDGEIVLILNPLALVGRASVPHVEAAPAEPVEVAAVAPARAGLVMVVDDSLTVRKITGRLLAREGYHVLLAKDGVDALEQLVDMVPDVMLVDIEMPRMDGFDLTRNVRADERLKNIPIVMITSRIADKHRNYARDIGVNHYLGKPYDEEELLRILAGYTGRNA